MSNPDQQVAQIDRHRSPGLIIFGIIVLAVAGWALSDGPALRGGAHLGWIAVGIGLVVGLLLILTGTRSQR